MKKILLITLLFISLGVNAQTYKLYQTHNIHNQLKLNTITEKYTRFKMMDSSYWSTKQ